MGTSFSTYIEMAWDSAGQAWHRMKWMLFTEGTANKWFMLGFSAWLMMLGQQGGGGLRIFNAIPDRSFQKQGGANVLTSIMQWCALHWLLVSCLAVAVLFLFLALWVLTTWLGARAQFVFLDQVAQNQTAITEPWRNYRAEGNSLFLWSIMFAVVIFVTMLVVLGVPGGAMLWLAFKAQKGGATVALLLGLLALMLVLVIPLAVVGAAIVRLLQDFVVPLMYRYRLSATAAWRYFGQVWRVHWKGFLAYLLLHVVLSIIGGLAVLATIICTCCIAGCLMMLPYLGAVILLPVTVYFRLYSLYFLQMLHPDYRLIVQQPPPLPAVPQP